MAWPRPYPGLWEGRSTRRTTSFLLPPTPQSACIPVFLEGHDVIARARTGSGKTLAYLLPALHRILAGGEARAWQAVVLVPTRELCSQVLREGERLAAAAGQDLRVTALAGEGLPRTAFSRAGQLVVTTPAKLALALSSRKLGAEVLGEALRTLVLDEADLLLAYGYGEDVRGIAPLVPRACQCMLLSATASSDVEALSRLVLHNPRTLDLLGAERGDAPAGGVAAEVEHWRLDIPAHVPAGGETLERLLRILALIRLGLIKRKVWAGKRSDRTQMAVGCEVAVSWEKGLLPGCYQASPPPFVAHLGGVCL